MRVATIPMTSDVAELIGKTAHLVENRSLLLDKFVFHKQWPVVEEESRWGISNVKWDEASRWSFLRIADGAKKILMSESEQKNYRARGRNVDSNNAERFLAEAQIAKQLGSTNWEESDGELTEMRENHSRRFIELVLSGYKEQSRIQIAQLEGRLAINLSDSLIQNAGICLDRRFGLPYIQGTAIKGVSRHAALSELKTKSEHDLPESLDKFCRVFGVSENDFNKGDLKVFSKFYKSKQKDIKGAISFLPAYPINKAFVVVDLSNVHYPDYYRSGKPSDLGKEKSRLNPFPAVEKGAQFAFCMVLNGMDKSQELLDEAQRYLIQALTVLGIGAKTAAGFGWFSLRDDILQDFQKENQKKAEKVLRQQQILEEENKKREEENTRRSKLSDEHLAAEEIVKLSEQEFAELTKCIAFGTDEAKSSLVQLLKHDQMNKGRWEAWVENSEESPEEKYSSKGWDSAIDKLVEKLTSEAGKRSLVSFLRDDPEKRQRWKTWKKKKKELASGIQSVCRELKLQELP